MRVIVCGGREFSDYRSLCSAMDKAHAKTPITLVIHGGASGADSLAEAWANSLGISVQEFPADWDTHGTKAGPMRNQRMLEERPDGVIAFPGGRGTDDMCRRAKAAGVKVWRPYG